MNDTLSQKATLVRKWCLISTTEAGSGHPTSCLSAADVMTVLFDRYYTYDLKNPHNLANDRLIFSKGHTAPLFYALYALAGAMPIEELKTLRKFTSRLEGHPTPHFPYTEAATGSLGQGLSVGAGLAIGLQKDNAVEKKPKVYLLLGDGEMAEGQVWEAANFAAYYKLDNLIAIVDVNGLGQSQATMFGHHGEEYARRFEAFGWDTIVINGHNFDEINAAFEQAIATVGKPVAIIANTKKGHGISFLDDKEGWHGKPLKKEDLEKALQELGNVKDEVVFQLRKPVAIAGGHENFFTNHGASERGNENSLTPQLFREKALPNKKLIVAQQNASFDNFVSSFNLSDEIGTREVYGKTLAELGKYDERIMALDGEVKNSTYAIDFMKAFPERYIECFIAEQNMVSVAVGLSRLGKIPFVSTFAAFLTRTFDQIRMARLSNANIKFIGSHAGVSIGEDGTSQMGLEDIAMFSSEPNTIVLHPSDAVSTITLIPEMVQYEGIAYLRTLRPKTPVIYDTDETFIIGGSKVLRAISIDPRSPVGEREDDKKESRSEKEKDLLTIVAAGITVHEALSAYDMLKKENIFVRIIDAYSIKPIDKQTLVESLHETKKNIVITVEDHYEHGGLGDAVLAALAEENAQVIKMAVTHISHSGTEKELLADAGIDARAIVEKVKTFVKK